MSRPDKLGSSIPALVVAALLATLASYSPAAAVTFKPAVNYSSTGVGTIGVAAGDFNGDGYPDIVLANRESVFVSVLLNRRDGAFAPAIRYTTNNGPYSVCTGDFDEDGHVDIASANQHSNDVSVLFGNGLGSFATAVNYPAGTLPQAITCADFDGDGHLDLAAANWNNGALSTVLIYLNQPQALGTFAPATAYAVGPGPRSLAVADFDRDGHLDLAVGLYSAPWTANIAILRNNGDGTFATPLLRSSGSIDTRCVVARDLNGDGWPDVATANQGTSNVSVLENMGNPSISFYSPVFFPAGSVPFSIAAGDFSLDGRPDLATGNDMSQNASVLVGMAGGGFASPQNFPVGNGHNWVATADWNGDGLLDLAVTNINDSSVSILINSSVALSPNLPVLSGPGSALAIALLVMGGAWRARRLRMGRPEGARSP